MKRAAVPLILFLFGFLLGLLCLFPMSSRPPDTAPALSVQGSGGEDGGEVPAFTSKDTTALLRSAAGVAEALKYKDYEALAGYVHPERGVTFTAYSTVNLETDQNFSADQIRELAQDDTRYLWGYEDGRGEPIQRTIALHPGHLRGGGRDRHEREFPGEFKGGLSGLPVCGPVLPQSGPGL